jgi:alanyl-tRNA synthetase
MKSGCHSVQARKRFLLPKTTSDIRRQFLDYFVKNGHREVASSSLVPAGDPTLLFTNAGMNQFKDAFLGREQRDYNRAATSQKCVRAGGKHNDLENVGRTARHLTFFEMLGNFSFGDYFKEDAIRFAWELIVDVWKLDPERLWFSVFEGDDSVPADEEAAALWVKVGARPERVLRFGKKDNFWSMGDTGPCGPCSEIHYFRGDDMSKNVAALVNGEGDDTMEIWNLVFMQYDRAADGKLTPLPAPSVDTGMGLERISSVLQKVDTVYDIDSFRKIIRRIEEESGHKYGGRMDDEADTAVRVLCDHARSAVFLMADGVQPSNEGRGFVLRRIIRRALRFGRKLPTFVILQDLHASVIEAMGDAYPELRATRDRVKQWLSVEESQFTRTFEAVYDRIGSVMDDVRKRGETRISGEEIFRLYDTFGAPLDLIQETAEAEGVALDLPGFDLLMADARAKAKASSKFQAAAGVDLAQEANEFVGYDTYTEVPSEVKAIVSGESQVSQLTAGQSGSVLISPTPFYAESGGQIGDTGEIAWPNGKASVTNTYKNGSWTLSDVTVEQGTLAPGLRVTATVPRFTRLDTTANHTATHLLHKALKDVLGETVQQAGSLVAPDRLRFDYTWHQPLTDQQIRRIEDLVNNKIRENVEVTKTVMPIAEAKKSGAVAMFGEKYGENVRIVAAGDWSREFCGGCHVNRTGDIGVFKIVSDRSLAAGVRRMEALTGRGAIEYFREREVAAQEQQRQLQEKHKQLEKELKQLRTRILSADVYERASATDTADATLEIQGVKLITRRADDVSGGDLRNLADTLRSKLKSGVVVLGSVTDSKVTLLTAVTKDLVDRVSASSLIAKLAPIVGGKGGGKPDLAQAGGKDPEKLGEALDRAPSALRELLGG